ncbi:MAG: DUF1365 domain-containing protein, partial [Pseudorhodobacter sp.]
MSFWPQHIAATTSHSRRGGPEHGFRYGVDYVLIDPEASPCPRLFSRNRINLTSLHDRDHGGVPGHGAGVGWARAIFLQRGISDADILLLAQPRVFNYVFNPVSFWLAMRDERLCAAIAEVNNTYGHSYFCANPDLSPIGPNDQITVAKLMHVSPFQDVAGDYAFRFDIRSDRIAIRIDFRNGDKGLVATLTGLRRPLTNGTIVSAL